MKHFFILAILFQLLSLDAFSQKSTEDVIKLKNGWILRGQLAPELTDDFIKITAVDGNVFVFQKSEVAEITKEPLKYSNYIFTRYKKRGFVHFTEMGALAARNTDKDNVNTSAFSFQTVNGYKFNQFLALSGGISVDLYATQTFLPLFLDLRGDIIKKGNLIPFYFLDYGYGINLTRNESASRNFLGGNVFAVGAGVKMLFFNTSGFSLSIGYRSQKSAIEEITDQTKTKQNLNYKRVAIRAGFTF